MIHGVPKEYDDRTYIELLIIKHTLKVAEQMKTEGDFVSTRSRPLAMRRYKMKILEELWYGNVTPGERAWRRTAACGTWAG